MQQAGFQGGMDHPAIENRGLAISNNQRGEPHSKKQNPECGMDTKLGRDLFHDFKKIRKMTLRSGRLGAAKNDETDLGRHT
jgi:hypothetical protein